AFRSRSVRVRDDPAMGLADEYRRQYQWRDWPTVYAALPPLAGAAVLDLGCAICDQAADLAARGARVVAIDGNEELLAIARTRRLPGVEVRVGNLFRLEGLDGVADGIWSSFAAAYFVDFAAVLRRWRALLRPGGWIALVEVDDLFGHEPLSERTR